MRVDVGVQEAVVAAEAEEVEEVEEVPNLTVKVRVDVVDLEEQMALQDVLDRVARQAPLALVDHMEEMELMVRCNSNLETKSVQIVSM